MFSTPRMIIRYGNISLENKNVLEDPMMIVGQVLGTTCAVIG